ncbi:MAG: hypothetical protein EA417_23065 [Gammaproteobacteria bacterium]|nr:MAG: hypothetical protein EA417_23065 [Gammaproteobacteria bacterium]
MTGAVSMRAFVEWLAGTQGSIALVESLHMYPLIETTHVLTLMLFLGTLAIVDLRLLGVMFNRVPVSEVTARVLPFTVTGFTLMIITGLLLFYAIPVRTFESVWFRMKVILMVAAGINAWLFHRRVKRDRALWDGWQRPPLGVRLSAGTSLGLWAGVIVTGRMIAYNWFDCDRQPQSDFINWAAGCVVTMAELSP